MQIISIHIPVLMMPVLMMLFLSLILVLMVGPYLIQVCKKKIVKMIDWMRCMGRKGTNSSIFNCWQILIKMFMYHSRIDTSIAVIKQ